MDTRIEELSTIIVERCDQYKPSYGYDEKAKYYADIRRLAHDIWLILEEYRANHPEEY